MINSSPTKHSTKSTQTTPDSKDDHTSHAKRSTGSRWRDGAGRGADHHPEVPVAYSPGRAGTLWRAVQAQVYAEETHCWLCRRWVDQSLPREHPMSRTVDHVQELWQGGDPLDRTNCRLAHRRCNSRKSIRARVQARGRRDGFTIDATSL